VLLSGYPPDFSGWGIQFQQLLPHLFEQGVAARIVTRRPAAGVAAHAAAGDAVGRILPAPDATLARLRGGAILCAHLARHRHDYDVVHAAFADWEFYLNAPFLAQIGLPTLHEMVLLDADDPLTIRRQKLGALKLRLMQGVDAWVGISKVFLPRVVEAGIPATRFRCIYPGIELDRYQPASPEQRRKVRAALEIPDEARVVVSVGSLLARKGMDRLVRAWARSEPRRGRDLLLLVGPASEREGLRPEHLPHVRELEAMASSSELQGTVRMVGRVDAVEDYMAAADVFALLSRQEGFGIVIAEALASGLPCLVSPLDGIGSEIIQDDVTGFVIDDPDDAEAVAGRLHLLLSQPEMRSRFGAAAVRSARERFSMGDRARQLAELYRSLMAQRTARG
jgi:glycosyltransferase involved in cell wall biosynthesis